MKSSRQDDASEVRTSVSLYHDVDNTRVAPLHAPQNSECNDAPKNQPAASIQQPVSKVDGLNTAGKDDLSTISVTECTANHDSVRHKNKGRTQLKGVRSDLLLCEPTATPF